MTIRSLRSSDIDEAAELCHTLWPDSPSAEHRRELGVVLETGASGSYPCALLVAEEKGGSLVGFVSVGMRSHADGCNPSKAVGYVEGWYVTESHRRQGTGRKLVEAAENWARSKNCVEMASDTWIDNEASQHAHKALGYEVVDRCVNYRKTLT